MPTTNRDQQALRVHAEQERQARRAQAERTFPGEARSILLIALAKGATLDEAAARAGTTRHTVLGRVRWDRRWRRALDLVLMLTRDESHSHGVEFGYRKRGCRCPECRAWNAARARRERGENQAAQRIDTSWHEPFLHQLERHGKIGPAAATVGKKDTQVRFHATVDPGFAEAVELAVVRVEANQVRPILLALRAGMTLAVACKNSGMGESTIMKRREAHPHIDALFAAALEAGGWRVRPEVRNRLGVATGEPDKRRSQDTRDATWQAAFVQALKESKSLTAAASRTGVTRNQISYRRGADPAFNLRVQQALRPMKQLTEEDQ